MPDYNDDNFDDATPSSFTSSFCSHVDILLPEPTIKHLIDFSLEDGLFWHDLIEKILLDYVNERQKKSMKKGKI